MAEDAFGIVGAVIAAAYRVDSVVAEGGFGTVYRAHQGGFRAPVALKCLRLPPGLSPEARQRFLESLRAEAELLFRLSASIPTVVRPLHVDAFTLPDGRFVPYLVLEWLEGHTLDALIRRRRSARQAPFSLQELVRLLTPVARALERAHHFQGPEGPISIVHRDLKPDNLFVAHVAGEEVVKILDYGIAQAKSLVSQAAGRVTEAAGGVATFTPAYGSPEQWAPQRYGPSGPWTDVWGLALTLTEALVGHPVLDGEPASIMGTVLDPKRRPTPGGEGVIVSDEVERVFEKALALDPRQRYADAGVFWDELLAAARITSSHPPRALRELSPLASSAALERSLSPAPAALPPVVSSSFEVPDLDVAPISRPLPRTVSGKFQAVAPPLELDDPESEPLVPLALDLPSHDPLHRRVSSGGMQAVRPPHEPPQPASGPRTPHPPARSSVPPKIPSVPPAAAVPTPLPPASPRVAPAAVSPLDRSGSVRPPAAASAPPPPATLVGQLLPGGVVVISAMLVTILDQVYSGISGEIFTLWGLRTSVLAGVVMLSGIGLCVYRLKRG